MERSSSAEAQLVRALEARAEPTRGQAREAGWVFGSVEDLALTLGRWFDPPHELTARHMQTTYSGVVTAVIELSATYVEGFVLTVDETVIAAAWGADSAGRVMAGRWGTAYLGVGVSPVFRRMVTRRAGAAAVLHGQQLDRFALLRNGIPDSARVDVGHLRR